MKTLYIECNMGAAGDMLMAALYELLTDEQKAHFLTLFSSLEKYGITLSMEQKDSCGIFGTHSVVAINGEIEEQNAVHHEKHEHGHHHHHHRSLSDVENIISTLQMPEAVKENAKKIYRLIAEAESRAHSCTVEEVHFHEVGTLDAIADVVGVSLLIEMIGATKIYASPIRTGYGTVECAHGILPVPAPATAFLLEGIPTYTGDIEGEFCTPTGAALLKFFAAEFGQRPVMRVSGIGYGMGTKQCKSANCVRAFIGETEENGGQICELVCNLDDITSEKLAFASEELINAGALDVYTTPILMKKGRSAFMLTCMCDINARDKMLQLIFKHTTTLGVREYICRRYKLERREYKKECKLGSTKVKSVSGYGVSREKCEYEDIARIARENNMTLDEVEKECCTNK